MARLAYVYNRLDDAWTMYENVVIMDGVLLPESGKNLVIDGDNNIRSYPGNDNTSERTFLRTKKYPLGGKKLSKIKVRFDGSISSFKINIWNDRFTDGVQEYEVSSLSDNVWKGLRDSLRGDYFDIWITGSDAVREIEVEIVDKRR